MMNVFFDLFVGSWQRIDASGDRFRWVCMTWKKMMNVLLINQLTIDLYSCTMAIPTYILGNLDIYLAGTSGYILCITFYSETLMWIGLSASPIGLVTIAVERYIKVVHSIWHKNHSKQWMAFVGCALSWASGFGMNAVGALFTNVVRNGYCVYEFPSYPGLMTYAWAHLPVRHPAAGSYCSHSAIFVYFSRSVARTASSPRVSKDHKPD
jgi:hypothetical protein